ncbi:MAG TPA: 1-acyl-sn-glycerol-3-phosphate acyltransferase [Chromatiaceae bacterium]|jgi:1-acyl-sn-glycerol-3-phosphate acyltransferase|nr:1-acyl-sn-glycerol-3-phosphate acyltransferase [Chromatiaceae bacterium]HIA09208.1 1-acyl-sn-glycerol-3-phosphate acyltransferase [Chromatiaceae bacterium]
MQLVRSLLFSLGMVISSIVITLAVLLAFPLSLKRRYRIASSFARFNLWSLKRVCGLSYRVEGLANRPPGAHLILCKHQSAWETLALQLLFDAPVVFVIKRELLWVPFFGWAMASLGAIAIDRKAGRKAIQQIICQGTEHLANGGRVVIFPEGTRTAPGERRRYGSGGAMLALASGYPVVPVAHNAGEFWRRRGAIKYAGEIQVVIGSPVSCEGMNATELSAKVERWIEEQMPRLSGK